MKKQMNWQIKKDVNFINLKIENLFDWNSDFNPGPNAHKPAHFPSLLPTPD